jgi:hypothetical protein
MLEIAPGPIIETSGSMLGLPLPETWFAYRCEFFRNEPVVEAMTFTTAEMDPDDGIQFDLCNGRVFHVYYDRGYRQTRINQLMADVPNASHLEELMVFVDQKQRLLLDRWWQEIRERKTKSASPNSTSPKRPATDN